MGETRKTSSSTSSQHLVDFVSPLFENIFLGWRNDDENIINISDFSCWPCAKQVGKREKNKIWSIIHMHVRIQGCGVGSMYHNYKGTHSIIMKMISFWWRLRGCLGRCWNQWNYSEFSRKSWIYLLLKHSEIVNKWRLISLLLTMSFPCLPTLWSHIHASFHASAITNFHGREEFLKISLAFFRASRECCLPR